MGISRLETYLLWISAQGFATSTMQGKFLLPYMSYITYSMCPRLLRHELEGLIALSFPISYYIGRSSFLFTVCATIISQVSYDSPDPFVVEGVASE